ncbi:uncharacterized protein BJ171DRAFT_571707 [Polychytrium aggregatum]|uniref:uncharacterized protein n=1 Tax=Polychytrium aggregatum TaxID=110093 RepID=UPI0022FE9DF6|nr:uncharacterized protein BJ171DRAFT_571707 [Polychytrium aggregatum]KAI9193507.1 hypothetical protein BJ171DRAFT_571707 [Polychytrium aggregatum]
MIDSMFDSMIDSIFDECGSVWQCMYNKDSSHQTIGSSQASPSRTQQSQAEASTASSWPDITQLSLEHNPDIFTIICCNDSFQLALDHDTVKTLVQVCKRIRPLLSSKVARFHSWCQKSILYHPDRQMRIGLTPSDQIAISLHCKDPVTADRSWLVVQADQGNAAASYFLAKILQVDLAVDQSADKSEAIRQQIFHHLESAAEAQHPMAHFHLARCYRTGLGVDQDQIKALELYRDLADRGMAQAQIALGDCYEDGDGVDQDYDTAIEWYSKAADQGSEDGRLHIVFLRAWFSFIGHNVEQSDADAFHHWQEVSTKSSDPVIKPIATHMLGWMHYLGRGTVRDEQKGVRIIRETKSDDFKLGEDECLATSRNRRSDSPAFRKLFELCQLGSDCDWLCKHLMAVCLHHGFGTTQTREKAAGNFEQLANEGHSDSQLWIGLCYQCGRGVSKDHKKAFEWYCKSANQGNPYGQWRVGVCYFCGYGVTQDFTKAVEWYRKSAEQDNRNGQFSLGECYKNGWGVPRDIDTAVFWWRKSADQGDRDAISQLEQLGLWP